MRAISELMAQPIIQAVGAALLHFLWQGLLVAVLVASLCVLLQKRTAQARYLVACAGLVLMMALPLLTVAIVYNGMPPTASNRSVAAPAADVRQPQIAEGINLNIAPAAVSPGANPAVNWAALMPWLVALWLGGVLIFSLRAAGGWLVVRRLRQQSNIPASESWQQTVAQLAGKLRVSRPVRLFESAVAEVPAVIGWWRPVILVPVGALAGLSAVQIEAVLAHELAHIRRHDYLVNLFQTAVENLLFYHPGVWWVSRRIRIERENCCDDLAVTACGDVVLYARALTALEGLRTDAAPQLALAADGGSLLGRVRRLLGVTASPSRSTAFLASFILMISVGGIGVGAHHALLPVVTAQAATLKEQVATLITGRPAAHPAEANVAMVDAHGCPLPHIVAEVNVPIPADANAAAPLPVDYSAGVDTPSTDSMPPVIDEDAPQDAANLIDDLAAAGYTQLTVDQIVTCKIQGVNGAFVRELKTAGYDHLPIEQLVAFRIQGITAEYAAGMNSAGFGRLEPEQLLAAKIHGASPEYLKQMRDVVKGADFGLLLAFRIHGVTTEYIKEFSTFGFGEPTANQLLAARIHGITGDYIKDMQGLGFGKLSWDKVLALRIHGVTPDFVKKARDRGFTDLTIDQILQLKIMGIIKDNG